MAQALFSNGGFRVLDGQTTVGFVWVEPAPGPPLGGQLQRWVLTKFMGKGQGDAPSFTFKPWGAVTSLTEWMNAMKKAPALDVDSHNEQWGEQPADDGLWPLGGAAYIVAQSTVVPVSVVGGYPVFPAVEPVYPRREVVLAMNRGPQREVRAPQRLADNSKVGLIPRAHRAGLSGPTDLTTPPIPQIVVPLAELLQWLEGVQSANPIGVCGGALDPISSATYVEGQELFLLQPEYSSVGTEGLGARWDSNVSINQEFLNLSELRSYIQSIWTEGCRYEVTGCNYYLGEELPDVEFL